MKPKASIQIITERADGSGIVTMPVLKEASIIDLTRTASSGKGTFQVTREMLAEIAGNDWPGPIPIHRSPHRSYEETTGPGDGFIDHLEVVDGELIATLDLSAALFQEVKARLWRGFSVDILRNAKTPTKDVKGWAVYGGVFTNRPAIPIDAVLAAAAHLSFEEATTCSVSLEEPTKERIMPEPADLSVRLATVEAEKLTLSEQLKNTTTLLTTEREEKDKLSVNLTAANKTIEDLRAENATLRATTERKERDATVAEKEVERLRTERTQLAAKVEELESRTLKEDVNRIVRKGIAAGIPPAMFDGFDENPVTWFKSKFVSLEALDSFVSQLPKSVKLSVPTVKSKTGTEDSTEEGGLIDAERLENLRSLGLNPKFAAVENSTQLEAIRSKDKK